jgi:rubrerythrin
MSFNPLTEKGIAIDQQLRNWSELNVQPYRSEDVDPYTRTRVITLNGVEVESVFFSHQFARHTDNQDVRRYLAMTRRVEQQQQKAVNWLIPGNESNLEVTIGYEQVAVDLTAYLARTEPDPYLKQAFEFGLLEDFDHLYRYANLLDLLDGKKAERITGDYTEIMPGRATSAEHRHPFDEVRKPTDRKKANPLSLLHAMTLVAAEQQTMNFYMTVGNRPMNPLARGLYLEIAQIEEQHVTHYESLLDPTASWFEREVMHQYNECYLYYSFMQEETDPRIKQLWELHLNMELEHLRMACELMKQYENKDPASILPKELPEPVKFQENKAYIRQVLESQVNLTGHESDFVMVENLSEDARYFQYQETVNRGGVPSEQVIEEHKKQVGDEYRQETEGRHPLAGVS